MTGAPPLLDGETIVFDHIPSLGKFKRTALILLVASLLPTAVFALVFPDTVWVILPLFLACMLLVQERIKLGRHRAWITNQRIILQDGQTLPLADVTATKSALSSVRLRVPSGGNSARLSYCADSAAVIRAISHAKQEMS